MDQSGYWTMRLAAVAVFMLLTSAATHAQDAVYLDHVDGLAYDGAIMAGQPITLYFAYTIEGGALSGASTGHIISSPDGATWSPPTIDTASTGLKSFWDGGIFLQHIDTDGVSPDTLGFFGCILFGPGLPVGYSNPVYKISFQVPQSEVGKTVCVDSSWYPPGAPWLWTFTGGGSSVPAWDGPHCFEVVPCCWDQSGDPTLDGTTNVADLDEIIDYLFRGGSLMCEGQANVDGESASGAVTVSDLSYFVAYLFQGGPPPAACQ